MTVCAWDVLRMWAGLQWSSECSGSLGGQWVRDAEQVVEAVKTAMYSGDTDLRLPSIAWDTIEAAWGTTWEKDWELDVADTPQRQCMMGSR
jgi:hypothetical protein